jgi:hypothetical protein
MFQFTTYFNDDSGCTLGEFLEVFAKHGLTVISQVFEPEWDETTIVLQGLRENFRAMLLETTEGDWGTDIEEFMEELEPV